MLRGFFLIYAVYELLVLALVFAKEDYRWICVNVAMPVYRQSRHFLIVQPTSQTYDLPNVQRNLCGFS